MKSSANKAVRHIALIAHDNCKQALVAWVARHQDKMRDCEFYATGTTGRLVQASTGFSVKAFRSGPLGGDQQIGALISEGVVEMLIFFWDPLEPMSHDPDIKALLRLATLWNLPTACNQATADFLINSPLFLDYQPERPDFSDYLNRPLSK
jgi:methylglyoxal synthase